MALFPFFRELSARGHRDLAALTESEAMAGRMLLSRGMPCGGAYLVLRGALRVFYFTENGREATLYQVVAGETCVLALSATLRSHPYPAWVQAGRTGASFLRIPEDLFHRMVESEAPFRAFVMEAMAARILELMTAMERLATATVVQRIATYLVEHAVDAEVQITQQALAAEIGTAREVVFRALASLDQARTVARRRGRIQILDRAALRALASGARPAP